MDAGFEWKCLRKDLSDVNRINYAQIRLLEMERVDHERMIKEQEDDLLNVTRERDAGIKQKVNMEI